MLQILFLFCPAIHLLQKQIGKINRTTVNSRPDIDEAKILRPLAHVIAEWCIGQISDDGEMVGVVVASDGESRVRNSHLPTMMENQSCQFTAIVGARPIDYLIVVLNGTTKPNEFCVRRFASS